jgi:hypothetical protein
MFRTFVVREPSHANAACHLINANWQAMVEAGKPLAVIVQEYRAKRSLDQNRRYWLLLNNIAENAWVNGRRFSSEAWHEHFKRLHIGLEETPGGGSIGISTTSLSVGEFADYMTKVEAYAADELGIETII